MNVSSIIGKKKYIIEGVILRLVVMPFILIGISVAAGFRNAELLGIVCTLITPTASATYNLATEMHADQELSGNLVIFQTLFSLVTIIVWLTVILKTGWVVAN